MEIWDFINPKITVKPVYLQRLKQLSFDLVHTKPNPTIKTILLNDYKIKKKQYKINFSAYKQQRKVFNEILKTIIN